MRVEGRCGDFIGFCVFWLGCDMGGPGALSVYEGDGLDERQLELVG